MPKCISDPQHVQVREPTVHLETEEETTSRYWMLYSAIKGHCILPCLPFWLSLLVWTAQKRARSAEKPSKTLTAIRGLRHPKRGRFHPKTALETRSKGCTKAALEQTCSAAAKSDQNDHFWHVFELVPEIIFRKSIFFFLGLN